ncbi:sigma-54-dependent transcriptional regulator [Arvimicrobium flavum]|uniref:sigma-54-dependent transcriptional regulator n=1 Tax=Arvimicrobium flavum TaxID=3393320 RepID=UPI00237A62D9|nr:sigma-54 dependent transcriptional regulator [Mesorhizobium shangrilense]
MPAHVLIVDDDPVQRRLLEAAVRRFEHEATVAENGEQALAYLEGPAGDRVNVVILDLMMPGIDGLGVLKRLAQRSIKTPVIVQTAQGGIETAVSAMRAGAVDFVVKPASPDRLQTAITHALKVEELEGETRRSGRRGRAHSFRDLITNSPAMERAVRLGQKAAASNIPILIEGESGVGKEIFARAIQGAGDRRSKPFVTVNCGAIPENLVESILFGHEKGSFTGATERHTGKFVEANSGTLFLDEIGDLPLDAQVKLLRAVQEGEVDPVGGRQTVKVDIKLISATHRDLLQQVKDGRFREDLFYRLNVYPIHIPPLRQRREDIAPLALHLAERAARHHSPQKRIEVSPEAIRLLEAYDWPGNVRQLENAILRAIVLSEGASLQPADFPQIRHEVEGEIRIGDARTASQPVERGEPAYAGAAAPAVEREDIRPKAPATHVVRTLDDRGNVRPLAVIELEMIRFAIEHYNGQLSEVARRLGIGRSTLYRKMKEYGIDPVAERVERLAS